MCYISDFLSSSQTGKHSGNTTNSFDTKNTIRGPNGMLSIDSHYVYEIERVVFKSNVACQTQPPPPPSTIFSKTIDSRRLGVLPKQWSEHI